MNGKRARRLQAHTTLSNRHLASLWRHAMHALLVTGTLLLAGGSVIARAADTTNTLQAIDFAGHLKLSKLTDFLDRLDDAEMHYTLASLREGAVVVCVTAPGERWEIEFMADGDVEVEIFRSDGDLYDYSMVDELFERQSEE